VTTVHTQNAGTVQVYRVYIKAPAQRIWEAITDPAWNGRYGYGAPGVFDLQPGGRYYSTASDEMRAAGEKRGRTVPDVIVDGEVVESDPPRRLVHTWRMLTDPDTAAEPFTRLTYDIFEGDNGVCRLTLTHELTGAPNTADMVTGAMETSGARGGGGWSWVLSDLKTLLETGSGFPTGSDA
jgi:uncharacterized protein YndB with AHSA1/START domain